MPEKVKKKRAQSSTSKSTKSKSSTPTTTKSKPPQTSSTSAISHDDRRNSMLNASWDKESTSSVSENGMTGSGESVRSTPRRNSTSSESVCRSDPSPRLTTPRDGRGGNADLLKVVVRIRPPHPETDGVSQICARTRGSKLVSVTCPGTAVRQGSVERTFKFDDAFGPECTQDHLYQNVGRPMLTDALNGYNTCLFAYGQTGSGKTYSLQGEGIISSEGGITSRICREMFSKFVDLLEDNARTSIKVVLTYYEVYNEHVYDLLQPKSAGTDLKALEVRQDADQKAIVVGLSKHTVLNHESVVRLLKVGGQNRHISNTKMNKSSSRSHSVLQLQIIQTLESNASYEKDLESLMTIVDLAGSERLSTSDTSGTRLEESVQINKSLSTLGRALNALADNKPHVPMRDSKLTRLLGDYFGGNSKTIMLATISPSAAHCAETVSTLEFALHAGAIKQCAKINKRERYNDTRQLQQQVEMLKRKLRDQEMSYEQSLMVKDMRISQLEAALRQQNLTGGDLQSPTASNASALLNSAAWRTYSQKLLDVNLQLEDESPSDHTEDLHRTISEQQNEVAYLKEMMEYRVRCHAELYRRLTDVTQSFREVQADHTHCAERAALQHRTYCQSWSNVTRALQDSMSVQGTALHSLNQQQDRLRAALCSSPCSNTARVLQEQLVLTSDTTSSIENDLHNKQRIVAQMVHYMEQSDALANTMQWSSHANTNVFVAGTPRQAGEGSKVSEDQRREYHMSV
mmetsp:Transcript_34923/g.58446  ORF Transcript_34923/g.58446 Transcript_34923/m.58446 type:complete len:744 (+) Transcript_34923:40-2271(+)